MELPHDSIGPTDLLAFRDCPRRFSYGLRRHTGIGKQSDEMTPEGGSWATDYGSAIHHVIHALEEGELVEDAISAAWSVWGRRLEPEDIPALRADAEKYMERDFPNTRTVLNEGEIRVPLMRHKGKLYYFRTRIDRLLERIDQPGVFIHVDFKSSRHPRSEQEVRDDLQLWMTNWAIHEYFPEVDELVQIYDQLKFGQQRTRKTPQARARIKDWIVAEATRVIEDEDFREDGLLRPTHNDWCAWCGLMESCPVVEQLSDWSKTRIAALAPVVKRGRKTVMDLDPEKVADYAERFKDAKEAKRILERFEKAVRDLLVEMPAEERGRLGFDVRDRRESQFTPEGLHALHQALGDRFYEIVKVTKTSLESELDSDLLAFALGLAEQGVGGESLVAAK